MQQRSRNRGGKRRGKGHFQSNNSRHFTDLKNRSLQGSSSVGGKAPEQSPNSWHPLPSAKPAAPMGHCPRTCSQGSQALVHDAGCAPDDHANPPRPWSLFSEFLPPEGLSLLPRLCDQSSQTKTWWQFQTLQARVSWWRLGWVLTAHHRAGVGRAPLRSHGCTHCSQQGRLVSRRNG